jgi:hypothetical protein
MSAGDARGVDVVAAAACRGERVTEGDLAAAAMGDIEPLRFLLPDAVFDDDAQPPFWGFGGSDCCVYTVTGAAVGAEGGSACVAVGAATASAAAARAAESLALLSGI